MDTVGRVLLASVFALIGAGFAWALWLVLAWTLLGWSLASLIAGYALPIGGLLMGAVVGWTRARDHVPDATTPAGPSPLPWPAS